MEKNIGQIGIGSWGKNLAKELHKQGVLYGIVKSSNIETNQWIKENLKELSTLDTIDNVLNDPMVKGVVIATPIGSHFDIAQRALSAGKHVFIEKPATDNKEKLGELIRLAEEKNLILQVGYEFVFSDKLRELQDAIKDTEVKKITFKWHKWGSFKAHPVINLLVHELSILKSLGIDALENIEYSEKKLEEIKESSIPEIITLHARSGDVELVFDINIASKDTKEKIVTVETDKGDFTWKDGGENLLEKELSAFASSIQTGEEPVPNGRFAQEILEEIEKIPWKK